jgi:UDP-N-acetylmuramoylalanine--D-glutamate ligase
MDVRGKRVVVMGLGSFSGGVSAARFMARRGARVVVTDLADADNLADSITALGDAPIEALHLGGHDERDFREAELVVASPAVREDDRFLAAARSHGARVTTEMNLFFELCPAPIVGVTGSNGKSTTTAMIHAMLEAAGRTAWLGGNIGRSLLEHADEIDAGDIVVLELSSFQLEDLGELRRSPHVAVVTTFTPNHLDRHPTIEAYRAAKQNILRFQRASNLAVLNSDDADVRGWPTHCRTVFYGLDRRGRPADDWSDMLSGMVLPGRHNQSNAVGAACTALALGVDRPNINRALRNFRTLPHRLELVAEVGGRRFFDDSIATTPESTLAALDAVRQPIWLIAGGSDKRLDLSEVGRRIAERAVGVALIGQTGPELRRCVTQSAGSVGPVMRDCVGIDEAVRWCYENSSPGHAVLLSPACASFGMFRNFVDRARAFRRAVGRLEPTPLDRTG